MILQNLRKVESPQLLPPLITFLLLSYNQEEFIEEAVNGALLQSYSPLEIIISDDCSCDNTFSIIEKIVSHYVGPHTIIVNKNLTNLGIGAHLNKAMELSSGELIVAAAGDDISLPDRVDEVVNTWNTEGRPVCVIYSDVDQINKMGGYIATNKSVEVPFIHPLLGATHPGIIGCTECWHRDLFNYFGPFMPGLVNEDNALMFRAELIGKILHVPRVLVKHRMHDFNTGSNNYKEDMDGRAWLSYIKNHFNRELLILQNAVCDLLILSNKNLEYDKSLIIEIKGKFLIEQIYYSSLLDLSNASGFDKIKIAYKNFNIIGSRNKILFLKIIFPDFYRYLRMIYRDIFGRK